MYRDDMTGFPAPDQEIRVVPANHTMEGMAYMIPDIVFSEAGGKPLKLQLLRPWPGYTEETRNRKYPLIVFIQGSAFRSPDPCRKIPQLSMFAQAGYVVASVTHRSSLEGNPFPAYLQDVKTAVRFLRAHAEEYDIDTARVAAWGSSSGGNTALLLGFTGDEERYKTDEYREYSDAVKAVVDCFGPADMSRNRSRILNGEVFEYSDSLKCLIGEPTERNLERIKEMDPVRHLKKGKKEPPVLIMHGDQDPVVPFEQSELLYRSLRETGTETVLVRVEGAPHERSFWSRQVLDIVREFLDSHV